MEPWLFDKLKFGTEKGQDDERLNQEAGPDGEGDDVYMEKRSSENSLARMPADRASDQRKRVQIINSEGS